MFSISNKISYEGTMKIQTSNPSPEKEKDFILEKSCWIDVIGQENSSDKDHYVEKQSEIVIKLIEAKLKKNKPDFKDLFVISPFTSVATGIRHVIDQKFQSNTLIQEWLEKKSIGTVHTFQGQEASEVIFLLGCDKNASPAIQWVNKNIVNVAATRAKYRFYIIGEEKIWVANNNLKIAKDCINNTIDEDELDISLGLKEISIDQLKLICPLCNKKMYPDEKKFYCSGYKSNPKCDFKIWKKSFQYGAFFSETDVKLLVNGFKTEKKECKKDDQKYLAAFKLNENGQLKKL